MIIQELIRTNQNRTISFGDYVTIEKKKMDNFEFNGDIYKLKTCAEVTRLEKNGTLFVETVPGSAFHDFFASSDKISFSAEARGDASFTFELIPDTQYDILVNTDKLTTVSSSSSGKLTFSVSLNETPTQIKINKIIAD